MRVMSGHSKSKIFLKAESFSALLSPHLAPAAVEFGSWEEPRRSVIQSNSLLLSETGEGGEFGYWPSYSCLPGPPTLCTGLQFSIIAVAKETGHTDTAWMQV